MPPGPHPGFSRNVFINCPLDGKYDLILRSILFTIIYLGLTPQIASQLTDSGEQRINRILSLIRKSKYSLHDLSRVRSEKRGEFFRLNMPFELGIDYGCRLTSSGYFKRKRFLVLGGKPYEYKRALSDLAGVDAKSHGNDPEKAVLAVRNWFVDVHLNQAPSGSAIWTKFIDFYKDFYIERKKDGFSSRDLKMMPVREFTGFIRDWLKRHRP